jgi:hypothetical protein
MSAGLSGLQSNIASLFSSGFYGASFAGGSAITSILTTAYGGSLTGAQPASTQNPVVALQIAQRNETRDIKAEAQQPAVQRDITAFTKAVKGATSVKQLLANPAVLKVLLTANGLGTKAGFPALAQKALMSDPADPKSLANQLASSNGQWLSTARIYQFATKGLAVIQNPKAISTITNGYAEVLWRQSLDQQTPGLSDALYFLQNAQNFTSATQVLGDSVMRTVVTTALGIPPQLAYQPLPTQERAITSRLNISNFQDLKFIQSFADRFLTVKQASAQSSVGSLSNLMSLAAQAQGLIA